MEILQTARMDNPKVRGANDASGSISMIVECIRVFGEFT
jgi:hypothetical protein